MSEISLQHIAPGRANSPSFFDNYFDKYFDNYFGKYFDNYFDNYQIATYCNLLATYCDQNKNRPDLSERLSELIS